MSPQMTDAVCKSSFFHLRFIAKIRTFLSFNATQILIHAFGTSKIDTYNALVFGVPIFEPQKLQRGLNAAARLAPEAHKEI